MMERKLGVIILLVFSMGFVFALSEEYEYNPEFYIALGVGAFGLLMVAYLIGSFLRSPKNKWKEKKRVSRKRPMPPGKNVPGKRKSRPGFVR